MSLNLHDWDMHDIYVKMSDMSVFQIICLYQDHKKLISDKALDYLDAKQDRNLIGVDRLEKEFEHLEREKVVIALQIADMLSEAKSV